MRRQQYCIVFVASDTTEQLLHVNRHGPSTASRPSSHPRNRVCSDACRSASFSQRTESGRTGRENLRTRRKSYERAYIRLQDVRGLRLAQHGHDVSHDLSQKPPQWPMRRRSPEWELRDRARHALRVGGGLGKVAEDAAVRRRNPRGSHTYRSKARRNFVLDQRHQLQRKQAASRVD